MPEEFTVVKDAKYLDDNRKAVKPNGMHKTMYLCVLTYHAL